MLLLNIPIYMDNKDRLMHKTNDGMFDDGVWDMFTVNTHPILSIIYNYT